MSTTTNKTKEEQLVATTLQPDVTTPNYSGYIIPSTGTSLENQQAANNSQNTDQSTSQQGTAQNTQQSTAQNTQTTDGSTDSGYDVSSLISLPGVSDTTKQALGSLISNGYTPSSNVAAAMAQLNEVIANQPAAFQSTYSNQLTNIMNTILGRQGFSYELGSDPMYQQYRQQYINAGRQAMQDSMGQAAAMTGGYGSSYAGTVGQQQYNQYLQQLADRVPELYQMAQDRYNAEGDALLNQYNLISDAYQNEYGQWQDQYDRWLAERDYAQGNYDQMLSFWQDQAAQEQDQANVDRDYYYDLAMSMLELGKIPSDDILRKAGLSDADIAQFRGSGSSGSGGSSKKSSGSSTNYAAKNAYSTAATSASKVGSAISSILKNASGSSSKTKSGNTSTAELLDRFAKTAY